MRPAYCLTKRILIHCNPHLLPPHLPRASVVTALTNIASITSSITDLVRLRAASSQRPHQQTFHCTRNYVNDSLQSSFKLHCDTNKPSTFQCNAYFAANIQTYTQNSQKIHLSIQMRRDNGERWQRWAKKHALSCATRLRFVTNEQVKCKAG